MDKVSEDTKSVVRETGALTAALYGSQLICVIRGLIVAGFLGPALFGVWNLFKAFFQCSSFVTAGSTQAVARQLPFNVGRGDLTLNTEIKRSALNFAIASSCIVAFACWISLLFEATAAYRTELWLAGFAFIGNTVHIYVNNQLRGEKQTFLLAIYVLAYTLICTASGLLLMPRYGIAGLIFGMLVANCCVFGYLAWAQQLRFTLGWHRSTIAKLITVGFPIMVVESAQRLMSAIDKLVIFLMLDSEATGYYALAAFFSETINLIPMALGAVLVPRLMQQRGEGEDIAQRGYLYDKPITLLACLVPIVLGLVTLNIELLLQWLLPAYMPALTTFKILIMGLFFSVILAIPRGLVVVFGRHQVFVYAVPLLLLLGTLLNILACALGYGIVGVAIASVCFYCLVALLVNIFALRIINRSRTQIIKTLLQIHLPFVYVIPGVLFLDGQQLLDNDWLNAVALSSIFALYCLPLLIIADRRLSLFAVLRASIASAKA